MLAVWHDLFQADREATESCGLTDQYVTIVVFVARLKIHVKLTVLTIPGARLFCHGLEDFR